MSFSYKELRKKTDDELIEEYGELAKSTVVEISYYADELERRQLERSNKIMTAVMLIATIINVCIAIK